MLLVFMIDYNQTVHFWPTCANTISCHLHCAVYNTALTNLSQSLQLHAICCAMDQQEVQMRDFYSNPITIAPSLCRTLADSLTAVQA